MTTLTTPVTDEQRALIADVITAHGFPDAATGMRRILLAYAGSSFVRAQVEIQLAAHPEVR